MAARENQGYLIAVIILVLLLIISLVVAFLGVNKANELAESVAAEEAKVKKAESDANGYQALSQILKAYIGIEGTISEAGQNLNTLKNTKDAAAISDEAERIRSEFEKDMALYVSSGGEDETANYRTLINNLAGTTAKLHNEKKVYESESARVQATSKAEIDAMKEVVRVAEDERNKTLNQLKQEKEARQADVAKLQQQLTEITKENKRINDENEIALQKVNNVVVVKNREIAKLAEDNTVLKAKVDQYEREVFDLPDGKILGVSPEIEMVVVNLGHEDGLRPNTTFSVFGKNVTNFQKDKHKAMIEITRVVGPHQSEGRITYEDTKNPIQRNDHILTATWDPGYRVHIALAGKFDLNNDGLSDVQQLIQQIERNSGMVVAYANEKGEIKGKIDASTRFFVLGSAPDPGTDLENYEAIVDSIRELDRQAKSYNVQAIDLKKLYEWMGQHPRVKIERTDKQMGDQFRKRTPASSLLDDR